VDDVVSVGATFAALRGYIVRNGGTVCAVTALGHKHGTDQKFPISPATIKGIEALYGACVYRYWKEAVGHDVEALTEPEGLFLQEWGHEREREGVERGPPLLHRLRTRLDQAASNSSE